MIRDKRDDILWYVSVKPLVMSKIDCASLILCNSYFKKSPVNMRNYNLNLKCAAGDKSLEKTNVISTSKRFVFQRKIQDTVSTFLNQLAC